MGPMRCQVPGGAIRSSIVSSWDTPNGGHDQDSADRGTSVALDIDSLVTADTGDYVCGAVVSSGGSSYVVDSYKVIDDVSTIVSKFHWEVLYTCTFMYNVTSYSHTLWSYLQN